MRNHLIKIIAIIAFAMISTGVAASGGTTAFMTAASVSQRHHQDYRPGNNSPSRPAISKEKQRLLKKADDCRLKAADYRRQAGIHLDKANEYRRQADAYLRHHQYNKANSAQKKADNEMRKYDQFSRKAAEQDLKAREYERQASRIR